MMLRKFKQMLKKKERKSRTKRKKRKLYALNVRNSITSKLTTQSSEKVEDLDNSSSLKDDEQAKICLMSNIVLEKFEVNFSSSDEYELLLMKKKLFMIICYFTHIRFPLNIRNIKKKWTNMIPKNEQLKKEIKDLKLCHS
ncbi:hypothetical protein CR513_25906, partial [Mucuna pruriens]